MGQLFDVEYEPDARRALLDSLLAHGVPAGRADEVLDLAMHATMEALRIFEEVVLRGSSEQTIHNTLALGLGVLAANVEAISQQVRAECQCSRCRGRQASERAH